MKKKTVKKGTTTKEKNGKKEVMFDFGSSLGGFLRGLGGLVDLASSLKEKGGIREEKEFTTKVDGKEVKGVYGFSISTAEDGKPVINTFGNKVKETPKGPVVAEEREPFVDVIPENDSLRIVVEMPGVAEGEIKVELKGDVLSLKTTGKQKYTKEILLPLAVKPDTLKKVYNNGILEITLEKK